MKSKLKWVSGILGAVLALSLVFGAGVYAAQNWMNFTGDTQIEKSESDVDEIMQILRDTHAGKLDAEKAYAELEAMNPKGLVDKIKSLEKDLSERDKTIGDRDNEIEELKGTNATLTTELAAVNQAKTDAETVRDNAIAERDSLQTQYNTLNDNYTQLQTELTQANEEIKHLRGELERANEVVANHAQSTNTAVEEARTYKE